MKKVRRAKRKKSAGKGKIFNSNRETGYYWIKILNANNKTRWIIAKWWQSLNFFDTMGTIREIGSKDKVIEVDENQIKRIRKVKINNKN